MIFYLWEDEFDQIEILNNYRKTLSDLIKKETRNKMFYDAEVIPSFNTICELIHSLACMIRPDLEAYSNYFEEIIKSDNKQEKSKFNFKECFKEIFKSECVKSFYIEVENWEELNPNYISEIENSDSYERFYERITFVPLPFFINGFTDATLITFVNSNYRKSIFKRKFQLKMLVRN